MMTLAQKVRWRRAELGLTQIEVKARSGLSVPTIISIESGIGGRPHVRTLSKLAMGLDMDVADLMTCPIESPDHEATP